MRVALISRTAHPLHAPGGMERAVYHLARHLHRNGVETVLLTSPATRDGAFPGEVITVPYRTVAAGRPGRVLDRTLNYPGFARRAGEAVGDLVRSGRVDVVHAQGLSGLGYGRARRRDPVLRAPLVMNPQGMEEHQTRGLKRLALTRLRALSREAARLADCVIATDEATFGAVPKLLGIDAAKVVVLPNGIDADEIAAATPPDPVAALAGVPGITGRNPILLSVGRLEAYKGFGDVRRAVLALAETGRLGPRWSWVVVGTGPYRAALELEARRWAGHVHLVGQVSEPQLHALYASAHLFVHATRFEGSSLVTLEAMAHGLPVVATRAGGIPDKVVDGETGRLVAPGDVGALTEAIAGLAGDGDARRRMGAKGRARVLDRFAWPALAERTIALYQELLEARR